MRRGGQDASPRDGWLAVEPMVRVWPRDGWLNLGIAGWLLGPWIFLGEYFRPAMAVIAKPDKTSPLSGV